MYTKLFRSQIEFQEEMNIRLNVIQFAKRTITGLMAPFERSFLKYG